MSRFSIRSTFIIAIVITNVYLNQWILAQPPAPNIGPGTVRINLRGETPLTTLVEYVSQRLSMRFVYDDSLAQKKINLQIPEDIPVETLFDLLQSALQINGLAIAQTETQGWYRIIANEKIPQLALQSLLTPDGARIGPATPAIQIFTLKRADPSQIKTLIAPFLTSAGANTIAISANKTLIVTDVSSNLKRIQRLIELLDTEQASSTIRFVKAQHVAVDELADRLQEIMAARSRTEIAPTGTTIEKDPTSGNRSISSLEIAVEPRTNQLILIGLQSQIDAAIELLKSIDVPLATSIQRFRPQFLSPTQLDEIIKQWINSLAPKPTYESYVEGATLVVTTIESVQQKLSVLVPQLDSRETSAKQSPIRFYKIRNVPVQDILETLNSLQGGFGATALQGGRSQGNPQRSRTTNDRAIPGQNNPFLVNGNTAQPGLIPPAPPAMRNSSYPQNGLTGQSNVPLNSSGNIQYGDSIQSNGTFGTTNNLAYLPGYLGAPIAFERGIQSPLGNAQVTADLGSNSLIIIAEPEVQQAYQQLIEFLDKRRPQVMIEARIVIIDTSDDYTLGVEVSGGDRTGSRKLFSFSSFGLSQVNPTTGALAISPSTGFNATLVDPNTADVVVRALATHRRARVLSSPKILVDDNAEGTLESVNEVPFTSVNASQTVATTSFAGFAKAGTTITVTPTISEAAHVNLDYVVTLNSFTGAGATGVPPPRQTNEIRSRVTVPDGYTIIVGGLTQKNLTSTFNGIPYLEKIPIIRELSSLNSNNMRDSSLFVFLRPVILEDDKFRDLRTLTRHAAKHADDGHNFPSSTPLFMDP